MNPLSLIGKIFAGGNIVKDTGEALDKLFTSDEERAEKKLEAEKAEIDFRLKEDAMDVELAKGQQKIDEAEAANPNWFVAGWRPAVGWVCVLGLTYQFLGFPLLCYLNALMKIADRNPPSLDVQTLVALLTGMLGLGGFRTWEKLKGVETTGVSAK
jgi:hypothetical protein